MRTTPTAAPATFSDLPPLDLVITGEARVAQFRLEYSPSYKRDRARYKFVGERTAGMARTIMTLKYAFDTNFTVKIRNCEEWTKNSQSKNMFGKKYLIHKWVENRVRDGSWNILRR